MKLINILKRLEKPTASTNNLEVIYSNTPKKNYITTGIELPKDWINFSNDEIKNQARKSILKLSRSSNAELKAKELGFRNTEHLMELCFDYILK
jgi:hypothetical protein